MGAISSWLDKFADFVNLGKLITDGGPGTLLAIALMMALATCRGVSFLPEKFWPEQKVQRAGDLQKTRGEIEIRQREIGDETASQAGVKAQLDALKTEQASTENLIAQLEKAGAERGNNKDWLPVPAVEEKLGTLRQRSTAVLAKIKQLEAVHAGLAKSIEQEQTDLTRLIERRKALEEKTVANVVDMTGWAMEHLVGLVFLGYVLGTMLSPVNRWLIELGRPTPPDEPKSDNGDYGKTKLKLVYPSQPALVSSFLSQSMQETGRKLRSDEPKIETHDLRARLETEKPTLTFQAKERSDQLQARPVGYWVGVGAVAKEEVDSYVTDYYRWAEASINMIIPTVALCLSFVFWILLRCELQLTARIFFAVVLTLAEFPVACSLYKTSHARDAYYRKALGEFLAGRIAKFTKQEMDAGKAQEAVARLTSEVEGLAKEIKDRCPKRDSRQ
jgi:hypothetical protein